MEKGQMIQLSIFDKLSKLHPFFDPVFDKFRYDRNDNVPTLGVSSDMVITYNSKFIESLSESAGKAVMMHEAFHIFLGHHIRYAENPLKDRSNRVLHNIAMDMEDNSMLKEHGYEVPDGIYPDNFRLPDGSTTNYEYGLTYEVYYKKLLNDITNQLLSGKGNNSGDDNNSGSGSDNSSGCVIKVDLGGTEGQYKSDQCPIDEIDDKVTTETSDLIESIKDQCEKIGKQLGQGSNGISNTGYVRTKKYPWNVIFRNVIMRSVGPMTHGYDFKSYCTINKKNACQDILLPVWRTREKEVNLIVIMDVSGSMYNIILDMYSKMKSIVNMISSNIKVKILETDTEVLNVIDDFDFSSSKITYTDGGGTDMRSGWKYIKDNKLNPDLIICMTDGYTPWPSKEDDYMFKDKSICIISDQSSDCPYKWYPSDF